MFSKVWFWVGILFLTRGSLLMLNNILNPVTTSARGQPVTPEQRYIIEALFIIIGLGILLSLYKNKPKDGK